MKDKNPVKLRIFKKNMLTKMQKYNIITKSFEIKNKFN